MLKLVWRLIFGDGFKTLSLASEDQIPFVFVCVGLLELRNSWIVPPHKSFLDTFPVQLSQDYDLIESFYPNVLPILLLFCKKYNPTESVVTRIFTSSPEQSYG